MTEREQFEVEFVKLNYQWSDANKDKAFLGWQMARAQPAQAGPITSETGNAPDQGASAITSESGKAGQVLTDDFIKAEALEAFDCYWDADDETLVNKYGHGVYLSRFIDFARAIEAAVLAKRVPITESAWQNPLHPDQISDKPIPNWTPLYRLMSKISDPSNAQHFSAEAAVKAFGIVGEKGGA